MQTPERLQSLLTIFNMLPLQLPDNYQQILAYSGEPHNGDLDPPFLLNDELISVAKEVIERFTETFTEIRGMSLMARLPYGIFR